PGPGLTLAELGEGAVDLGLALARQEEGLRVGASVERTDGDVGDGGDGGEHAGSTVEGEKVFVVGRPRRGLGPATAAGALTAWPLGQEPALRLVGLLERGEPVLVPAPDVPRFLADYYPSLARAVRVTSRDGTGSTPDAPEPVLRLVVRAEPDHRVYLAWSFS